jgi:hypothetical protein
MVGIVVVEVILVVARNRPVRWVASESKKGRAITHCWSKRRILKPFHMGIVHLPSKIHHISPLTAKFHHGCKICELSQ